MKVWVSVEVWDKALGSGGGVAQLQASGHLYGEKTKVRKDKYV